MDRRLTSLVCVQFPLVYKVALEPKGSVGDFFFQYLGLMDKRLIDRAWVTSRVLFTSGYTGFWP